MRHATKIATFLTIALAAVAPAARAQPFNYFPGDAATNDGRFVALAGTEFATFNQQTMTFSLAVPPGVDEFDLGIFDGETGGTSFDPVALKPDFTPGAIAPHWDNSTTELQYVLFYDPLQQASTDPANEVARWRGNSTTNPSSGTDWVAFDDLGDPLTSFPDNGWWNLRITIPEPPDPLPGQAPSGAVFYHLCVSYTKAPVGAAGVDLLDPCTGDVRPNDTGGLGGTAQTVSNFKLRATANISVLSFAFAYEGAMRINFPDFADVLNIYPTWLSELGDDNLWIDSVPDSTYDGSWSFKIDVPANTEVFELFDGDFDFGTSSIDPNDPMDPMDPDGPPIPGEPSGVALINCDDLDDPDTPNVLLPFATGDGSVPEGEVPEGGTPADDNFFDSFRRDGCVTYTVTPPGGPTFVNVNPSSQQEWEQFRVSSEADCVPNTSCTDPSTENCADVCVAPVDGPLPPGLWDIEVSGVDLSNLNAWRSNFSFAVGDPPPRPYLVGDTVFDDGDFDGVQDPGEPGIPGVVMELLDATGGVLETLTTGDPGAYGSLAEYEACVARNTGGNTVDGLPIDAAGVYCFDVPVPNLDPDGVDSATYSVRVAASNFLPGGALFDYFGKPPVASTASPSQTNSVPEGDGDPATDDNVMTYDFGYTVFGSIGDRVWFDRDGDGVQDDPLDEPGLGGVTVELRDPTDDSLIATDVTAGDGGYLFDGLLTGSYKVVVVASTLPADFFQTFDLDGSLDDLTTAPLAAGQDRRDVDFGYTVCGLTVDKTCQVVPDPEPFDCGDAKPLDVLTMIWNGAGTVDVKAWKGPVGSTLLDTVSGVAPGAEVSIAGYAGSPNDVFWEIFAAGTSTKLGESKFHLSCSDDFMDGAEDCGEAQGNGKSDDAGFLNDWALEGLAGNGLELDCNPVPDPPAELCEVVGRTVSCDTAGDPDFLTWTYTGGGCDATANSQEAGKHVCTETPTAAAIDGGQPVTVTDEDGNVFVLQPGEEFTTTRGDSKELTLTQPGVEEFNLLHVSCSQPLIAGEVFGSLTLAALDGQRAGSEILYTYEVTNVGAGLTGVSVVDDQLGPIGDPFDLASGGTNTLTFTADIAVTTINRVDAAGTALGGTCEADPDFVTVTVTEPCDVCDGGTTDIVFQYQGAVTLTDVVIYDKSDVDPNKILFGPAVVNPGDQVSITRRAGQSKLASDVSIWVDGVLYAELHTSCSQPIGEGLFVGDFLIVEARSVDNGLMCPLDVCNVSAAELLEFSGQEVRWDLTNNGEADVAIDRITVTWLAANGALIEVKRDGDKIHDGDFSGTSADINGGWEGDLGKRTIDVGNTDTLKLKFANDAVTDASAYQITVEFDQGCSVTFVPPPPPIPGCEDFECSKPIDALFMIWDGTQPVRVKAWKGEVGTELLADLDNIAIGQEVQVFGYAGSPNDVTWEIFAAGTSTQLGESIFHLSCSDDEMDGFEDVGSRQGNGKSNDAGLINDWIFEGLVDSDETLDCNPDSGPPVGGTCVRVSSDLDDVEERLSDGDVYVGSSDLELIDDSDFRGPQIVGIRFQGVSVPQGAAITSAFIEFETDETDSVATSLTIRAEAADDAAPFADVAFDVSSRATTGASVGWNPPAWLTVSEKHQTPDLSAVVEEVVGRPGWTSGNSMAFVISGSGERTAESFDGEAENAPLLCASFTTAADPDPEPCPCVGFGAGWIDPSFVSGNWDVFVAGLFNFPATTCTDTGSRIELFDPTADAGFGATAAADSTLLQCEITLGASGSATWPGLTPGEALGCRNDLKAAYEGVFGVGSCP